MFGRLAMGFANVRAGALFLQAHAGGRATFMQTEMDHMLDELDALRVRAHSTPART